MGPDEGTRRGQTDGPRLPDNPRMSRRAIALFAASAIAADLPCVTASDGTPVLTSDGAAWGTTSFSAGTPANWDGKSPSLDPSCQGFSC